MRPGRLPENHPKEIEARKQLRVEPQQEEIVKKEEPKEKLPQYKKRG